MMTAPSPSGGALDVLVDLGGLRAHYRELGDPTALPTVVLHGIMGHCREWDPLCESLAGDRRVIALDQRGHGESAWAREYSAKLMAGDLVALLEGLQGGPADVIGHSMGAMAAVIAAAERPGLVNRLVLLDLPPDAIDGEFGRTVLPDALATLADASYADPREALEEWLAADPLAQPTHMRRYIDHALTRGDDGRWRYGFDAAGLVGFARAGVTAREIWTAIDGVRAPTLVVRGERSDLLPARTAGEIVRRLGDAMLVEIPGAGHDLGVQRPEPVAQAVRDFLGPGRRAVSGGGERGDDGGRTRG